MKRGFCFFTNKKTSKPRITKPENVQKTKIKIPTGSPFPPPNVNYGPSDMPSNVKTVTLPRPPVFPHALCLFHKGTKDAILSTPGFPVSFHQDPSSLPYEIRTAKGAGLGVFATKDITPGNPIIIEHPLLVIPRMIRGSSRENGEEFLQRVVDSYMNAKLRSALLALHNCKGREFSPLLGIINTNSVMLARLPGPHKDSFAAVCEKISRVNHSCSPNAIYRFDLPSFSFVLHALTAIPAGTEITISYLSTPLLPYASRRYELRDKYTFVCTCARCSLPKAQRTQSDTRREVLRRHAADVDPAVDERELCACVLENTGPMEPLVTKSLAVMGMMEEEGLNDPGIWPVHIQRLVKTYAAFGDAANAQMWARRAAELTRAFTGTDGGWGAIEKDIDQTDWWGLRVGEAT